MKTTQDLQIAVNDGFLKAFGRTPLTERLRDILGEAIELSRYTDLQHLKEETGDLMTSLIMLCNEAGWEMDDIVVRTLEKINHRKEQYHALGRKIKVAILGGAFDPVTKGHIDTAQFVLNTSKKFDEVWLMPCFAHMHGKEMASPQHRFEMCKLAAEVDGRIRVCDYEIKHEFSGETYKLAKQLLEDADYEKEYSFTFIIGQDNANSFHTWVNFEELERLVPFVVVPRQGVEPDFSNPWYLKPPHVYLVGEREKSEISSTQIRIWYASVKGLIKHPAEAWLGNVAKNWMDHKVLQYIADHGLADHYAERGKIDWEKQQK